MRALKPCPAARAAPHHQARPTGPRPIAQRAPRIHAAAAPAPASDAPGLQASPAAPPAHASSSSSSGTARRDLLLLAVASPALLPLAAQASGNDPVTASSGGEYDTFFGFATPPTSYGGYGGTANEPPKYSFEYPAEWKTDVPSKSEKGTKGIDGRVVSNKGTKGYTGKGQRAFVITLGRAGEDNKSFRLADLDQTFQGFASADYDLQDALAAADNVTQSQREVDGLTFYDYDIDSPATRYLATISVKYGKVYALFVKSPSKEFKANEGQMRHIIETFKLIDTGY